MKVRNSHISNSSSSSFVLAIPKGKMLSIEDIANKLCPKEAPLHRYAIDIAHSLFDNSDHYETIKDYLDYFVNECGNELHSVPQEIWDLYGKDWKVFVGSVSTDNGGIEELIAVNELKYEDEEMLINVEGY